MYNPLKHNIIYNHNYTLTHTICLGGQFFNSIFEFPLTPNPHTRYTHNCCFLIICREREREREREGEVRSESSSLIPDVVSPSPLLH
ncbi:hypothetical protein HanXRQr2_Chr06g0259531 [Helianthus annuus]|uniref:Uncharacterized protein n=1 Tax=Helianthus annuus TaxID=4232 RepID=A0A9K3IT96_HELAN|nr:hypothetical protein HanXRQr2_Chr06g0259531 [Helianthus annuus]KAJ0560569.1 hypothetical protein HanHA300_Chr06g0212821 [Helianthus annuus]KAJ0573599.1 hypothetical protein HanHA89_Chr06g0228531 [Helianthus annuus]KAJ0737962.1 hypothetical protein HanLR1_Chr06g0212761 [Helianthus annuus]KAJ0740840.1 hypothetical protein HanOQP8_Chr06g0221241 [Helianthus annuus]